MTKYTFSKLPILTMIFSLVVSIGFIVPASYADNIKNEKLEKVKKDINTVKKDLNVSRKEKEKLSKELETSEKSISELQKKIQRLKKQIEKKSQQLNENKKQQSQLKQQQTEHQSLIAQQVIKTYKQPAHSQLKVLLSNINPADAQRMMRYQNSIIASRNQTIAKVQKKVKSYNQLGKKIALQASALKEKKNHANSQRQKLNQQQHIRKQLIVKLDSSINNSDIKLDRLEKDRNRLHKLLSRVNSFSKKASQQRIAPSFSTPSYNKGKMQWPNKGKIVKQFGASKVGNKLLWNGILIASPAGSPVKAAEQGSIVFADYLRGHGLLIIVDHGKGFMTLYAHNQQLFKNTGEHVNAGDTIASVGNSGGQQQAALYFEIRYKGKPQNPQHWLARQ